jgi:hypothetical protein
MQVLLAACTLSFLSSVHVAHAAPAALVEFAIGNVNAVNSAGVSRSLDKGAEVQAGDTIDTGTGRAQLRFSDGAYISLQPGSQFRIDEYNYAGKSDDSERGFFSLIKGGMRTITGLIGRSNRRNYQVRVPVATIGIRGTEYTLLFDGTALGTVGEGEISVCNGAGCLNVASGQSYFVAGSNVKPELSAVRSFLPPPPVARLVPRHSGDEPANAAEPGLDLGSISSTNDRVTVVDGHVVPTALIPQQPTPVDLSGLFGDQIPTGSGPQGGTPRPITTQPVALALAISQFPSSLGIGTSSDVKSTSADVEGGKLVSWTDTNAFNVRGAAGLADNGNLGQIAWGRFNSGTLGPPPSTQDPGGTYAGITLSDSNSLHYVVGKETPAVNLPTTGTLNFNLIAGATTPTTSTPAPLNTSSRLESASLSVVFDATVPQFLGTATAAVTVALPDNNRAVLNASAAIPAGHSTFQNVGTTSGSGCASCSRGNFAGMLAGPNAQYAGFTYGIDGTTFGDVRGAVVLRR